LVSAHTDCLIKLLKSSALWSEPLREVAYITLFTFRVNAYFKAYSLSLSTRLCVHSAVSMEAHYREPIQKRKQIS
ncbi:hypothetical protein LES60_21440, partial [Pectobacterium brasiliense]|uniref:hypothetical protein n=1 Tax=Pectobacterium brasiliense TaxID=180957 RepID=UPI001CE1DD2B